MKLKPWTIYLWKNDDNFQGATVTDKNGEKNIFCFGWQIEEDPEAQKNTEQHQQWRAVTQLTKILNNTLNAVDWYGNKILMMDGDIDPNRFNFMEHMTAYEAVKKAQDGYDMSDVRKEKKYPSVNITPEQAKEFKFI